MFSKLAFGNGSRRSSDPLSHLDSGKNFSHLKNVIKIKELEKIVNEPLFVKKNNKFAIGSSIFEPSNARIIEDMKSGNPQIGIGPGAGSGNIDPRTGEIERLWGPMGYEFPRIWL